MLADGEFNSHSPGFGLKLLRRIKKAGLRWRAYGLARRPTPDQLAAIRESGCESLLLTIDSGAERLCGAPGRPGIDEVGDALDAYLAAGVPVEGALLFGLPGETFETIDETVALIRSFPGVVFNYACGARLYPNTPLATHARGPGAGAVYRQNPDDPMGVEVYSEPAPPWEIEQYLSRKLGAAVNARPLW